MRARAVAWRGRFSLLSSSSLRERSDRLLGLSLSPPSPLEIGGVSSRERYDPLLLRHATRKPLTLSLWPLDQKSPPHENARSLNTQFRQVFFADNNTQLRQRSRTQFTAPLRLHSTLNSDNVAHSIPHSSSTGKTSANKNDWKEQERLEVTAIPLCLRWQN